MTDCGPCSAFLIIIIVALKLILLPQHLLVAPDVLVHHRNAASPHLFNLVGPVIETFLCHAVVYALLQQLGWIG